MQYGPDAVDSFDPAYAPGVAQPEGGGLAPRDVIRLLQRLPQPWVGADIVEVLPARDVGGITATLAAKLVEELVDARLRCGSTQASAW